MQGEHIEVTKSAHNRKILKTKQQPIMTKCREITKCPIPDRCNTKHVVYEAKVKNANYIEMTEGQLKIRYNNHTHSFREETKRRYHNAITIYLGRGPRLKSQYRVENSKNLKKTYKPGNSACDLCQ